MNINSVKLKFPRRSNISSEIKDLIKGLLTRNVGSRLKFEQVLSHSSFCDINQIEKIENFQLCPPIIPLKGGRLDKNNKNIVQGISPGDHSNFKKWKEPAYKKKKPLTSAELQYTNIAGSSFSIQ